MYKKRPDCSDFIIATVRKLRRTPENLTPGTSSGMSLERLWGVVREVYSEDEFRKGLEHLLAEDAILITADQIGGRRSEVTVVKIPSHIGDCSRWYLDEQGEYLSAMDPENLRHTSILRLLVYVQADGLPRKAQRIKKGVCRRAVAQAIMENTMPQPTRFHLGDFVRWNEDRFSPDAIEEMKRKYGEGPFEVVAVCLHTRQARESSPEAHPEAVTIELANEERQEFSGSWFKKV